MELYGSIQKKQGGFPTLNPTLNLFKAIFRIFIKDKQHIVGL